MKKHKKLLYQFINQLKIYFMKRKTLQKLKAQGFWTLLLVLLFGLFPGLLKAQLIEYRSVESNNILIGTSDTRLMASIYETDTTVTMKVKAIGYMKADMITFAFFYDPEVLKLCDTNYKVIDAFGLLQIHPERLNAGLTAKSWSSYTTHKEKGISFISRNLSGHQSMRAVLVETGCPILTEERLFVVEAGRVEDVFEVSFRKVVTAQKLVNENIGIGAKTTPIAYQPKFGHDGYFLWYKDVLMSSDKKDIDPNLFLYRSGSSVSTGNADDPTSTTVQLYGSFKQGAPLLPPSTSILDTTENETSGKGKLNHDTVKSYGFIYSLDNVTLSIAEFSDSLKIGDTYYNVPTAIEIAAGTFSRGIYNFYIKIVDDNDGVADELGYNTTITGLIPDNQYYAWAYMHYNFETSDLFQAVGERITFTTSDCVPLLVGTVFTKEEPNCKASTGKIQVNVTGGSGHYLYKVNDNPFTSFPGGEITGLTAGTYTIVVQDSIQVTCPTVTINNFVLHNGNTDLFVSMTSENATTCESEDGVLYVNVTGGKAPYKYILNGEEKELTDGMITERPVGIYVLNVTDDDECFATSGEVRINSSESTFDVLVAVDQHTTCLSSIGKITMTVEGTTAFTYQVDGYPQVKITDYTTPIEIENLSAGLHYIRVIDSCGGEIVKDFIISNGSNALAFTAVPTNEMLSCDNELIPGSITLNVTHGALELEYSIDGVNFEYFPTGETEVTITGLHQGFYRVVVRDGADCTYEVNQITIGREILTPIHVGTYYTAHEPNCQGDNGAIQMHVTGGSGLYLYEVNNELPKYYPNGLITGLSAGTYTIVVSDSITTGCSEVVISNIVLHNANTDLNVSMIAENASTCTDNDGKLYVTVTGGKPEYSYILNGTPTPLTHGMIDGQTAGVYVLEVKDGNECVASSGEVRIYADGTDIKVFTEVKDAICGSSTGEVEFYVTGAANYTYQIDGYPKETGSGTTPVVVNGLSAGLHYIRISNNCGEVVEDFTITNGDDALAFTATPAKEVLTCNNDLLPGSITLNVSNGTPNFKYRVDGGAWINFAAGKDTVTITGLHTGVYRVEVKDTTGCTYEVNKVTIEREIFTPIQVGSYYTATEPDCRGTNGAIQMHVTGGSGLYLYKVNSESPKHYPNGLITGLGAGTYTITVQDSITTGCTEVIINNIVLHSANTDLNVSMIAENASTCNDEDGKLYFTVTGGKPEYHYYLDGDLLPLTHGMIDGKAAGVYVLKVEDADGCVASSGEVRIYSNTSTIDVDIHVTNHAICGLSTGAITFNVSNSANYTYQIDGYPEGTGSGTADVVVNGLSAGLHYLRITDNCGEIVKDFTVTNGGGGLLFTATPEKEIYSCDNELKPGSIFLNVSNGTLNYKYRVDGGEWKNFAAGKDTVTITGLNTGVYVVEVNTLTKAKRVKVIVP